MVNNAMWPPSNTEEEGSGVQLFDKLLAAAVKIRPMLMTFMFLVKIFQIFDEGGRSSLPIIPLFFASENSTTFLAN